jgi:threonine synthase
MTEPAPSSATLQREISRLRCISCGSIPDTAGQDFRCKHCGDLLEVFYPDWETSRSTGFSPVELKSTWLRRRSSFLPEDGSGVWRFRELLPRLKNDIPPITLREGNTPLYELPVGEGVAGVG